MTYLQWNVNRMGFIQGEAMKEVSSLSAKPVFSSTVSTQTTRVSSHCKSDVRNQMAAMGTGTIFVPIIREGGS